MIEALPPFSSQVVELALRIRPTRKLGSHSLDPRLSAGQRFPTISSGSRVRAGDYDKAHPYVPTTTRADR
jgi:hypothetical protein